LLKGGFPLYGLGGDQMNPHTYMQCKNRKKKMLISLEVFFVLISICSIILTVRGMVLSHNRSKEEQAAAMYQNSREAKFREASLMTC